MKLPDGLFRVILENISDAVYFTDRERRILYWNRAAEELTGFKSEEVVGKKCSDNILQHVDEKGKNLCLEGCPLSYAMKYDAPTKAKVYFHHKDGHRIPVVVKANPIKDKNGKIVGAVEVFFDNSYEKQLQEQLNNLKEAAMLDELTKLSNRRYIELSLQAKILEAQRYNRLYGILFIDLDNFKDVNDNYGHVVGDKILKMVATTLRNNVRYFDVVGRLGGDEFVVIAEVKSKKNLELLANKLLTLLKESYIIENNERIQIKASIGGYILSQDDTVEKALNKADMLMYESKKRGKGVVTL
jgi:diguanylate cyclase (GGDEF)-like protein/PAS domain S-box-containing protein